MSPHGHDRSVTAARNRGTYNLAALVPTTSVDDDEVKVPRLFGFLPVNLLVQNVLAVITAIGYWLDVRGESPVAHK